MHLSQKLLHARDQVKKKRETRSDHHHQHHHEEEEDRGFFLLAPIHSFIPSTSLFVMTQSRRSDGLGKPALGRGRQKMLQSEEQGDEEELHEKFLYLLKGMHAERNEYARKKRAHSLKPCAPIISSSFLTPFILFSFSPSTPSPPVNSFPIERSNCQTRFSKAHTVALTGQPPSLVDLLLVPIPPPPFYHSVVSLRRRRNPN